jgi:hypothetical protein
VATRHLLTCRQGAGSEYCFSNVSDEGKCPVSLTGTAVARCDDVCDCSDICDPDEYAVQLVLVGIYAPDGGDAGTPVLPASCRDAPGFELSSIRAACCKCD